MSWKAIFWHAYGSAHHQVVICTSLRLKVPMKCLIMNCIHEFHSNVLHTLKCSVICHIHEPYAFMSCLVMTELCGWKSYIMPCNVMINVMWCLLVVHWHNPVMFTFRTKKNLPKLFKKVSNWEVMTRGLRRLYKSMAYLVALIRSCAMFFPMKCLIMSSIHELHCNVSYMLKCSGICILMSHKHS